MTPRATALVLAFLSACSSALPAGPVTVNEVIQNIHVWNGKQVTVDGWLGRCAGYDCAIFPDLKHARGTTVDDWRTGLSIGSPLDFKSAPVDFDEQAGRLQFTRVLLTARINDECFPVGCTDRADILQPVAIRAWRPSLTRFKETRR